MAYMIRHMKSQGDHIEVMAGIASDEDRLPNRPLQWLALMVIAAFVGAVTGLVGVAFRISLMWADYRRNQMIAFAHAHFPGWIGWVLPVGCCAVGAGLALWLTQRLAPQTAGSGIPRVESVVRNHLKPANLEILPVKFSAGSWGLEAGWRWGARGRRCRWGGRSGD